MAKVIQFDASTKKDGEVAFQSAKDNLKFAQYFIAKLQKLTGVHKKHNGKSVKVLRDRRRDDKKKCKKKSSSGSKDSEGGKKKKGDTLKDLAKSDDAVWRVRDEKTNEELDFRVKWSQLSVNGKPVKITAIQ